MEGLIQMAHVHKRNGTSVEVVCFDEPDSAYLKGLPVVPHPLGSGVLGYAYNPRLVPWLKDNLHRFDAIVVNGLWQYHAFGTWRALRKSGKPYFVYTHGMLDPWFKHAYPLKHLKKWLYWPWADYRVLRDAAAVLFTCEEEKLLAPNSFWLYKVNPRVVKYGAATPPQDNERVRELFLDAFPDLRGKKCLLFLSRIHEKKGCDLLIEAFASVADLDPDIRLIMAGPDQSGLVAGLMAQAERLGVSDRIVWTGMLRAEMKWGAFYASELFVLPSHQENFGIAVAEALGCGVPVLISNKVNIWREIESDQAGLVGNDDVVDTEANLRRWVGMSSPEKQKMMEQARATFKERYTVEQMASSMLSTIKDCIE
jgi:glycosyltransferase involved in cell wall biosynthesis